jgi:sigma-B regulation protein RsbU (phosphoserine phosphatase)
MAATTINSSPISLLIVDDDPVFARFLQQLLRVLGQELPCIATWVDSAEKALEEIRHGAYDLALLDYNLPGADGLALLGAIQDHPAACHPAVIMLTASGSEAIAVEAMKRGAKDYLPKAGLDLPPLTRAIQSALAQKRLAEQVAAYHAQIEADLAMGRSLQQSLLPEVYPCFPRSATPEQSLLRFCHRFLPARELAGDFFSLLGLSDSRAGVFICDVMGHGVRSALVTAILRALLDDLAPRVPHPGEFLAEMNRKLARMLRQTEDPLFATAFYLVADTDAREMRCANAGHPPPLHLQRTAGQAVRLAQPKSTGPALGLFPDATYPASRFALAAGDVVLLFTDGLFEVVDASGGEDYGQERLLAAARRRLRLPPATLCDELIAEARAFSGAADFNDDVCLVGLEVKP